MFSYSKRSHRGEKDAKDHMRNIVPGPGYNFFEDHDVP